MLAIFSASFTLRQASILPPTQTLNWIQSYFFNTDYYYFKTNIICSIDGIGEQKTIASRVHRKLCQRDGGVMFRESFCVSDMKNIP